MVSLIPWKKKNNLNVRREGELVPKSFIEDNEFYPMARFRRDFDQLWNRFWDDWGGLSEWRGSGGWNFDLDDKENEYLLHADLPGFEPDEIDVSVSGNVMTVRAEHKEEDKSKNGSSYRYGQFYETFTLPSGVLSDKIDARYHNGVLEVHLPKSEECKAKRITVRSA